MINNKKFYLLKKTFLTLILLTNVQLGYAKDTTYHDIDGAHTPSNLLAIAAPASTSAQHQLSQITYDDEVLINNSRLEFKNPGAQPLVITNNSKNAIKLKEIYFSGDQFSTYPLIGDPSNTEKSPGISMVGFSNCTNIPAKTSCAFVVNADKNANPTIYNNGQRFFINYTNTNDNENDKAKETKLIDFTVKIAYNNDISFGTRNLVFPIQNQAITQKLTIVNNNSLHAATITKIQLLENENGIEIENYGSYSNLEPGSSRDVNITVFPNAESGAIPVNVIYDIDDKKDLMATAAIIIRKNDDMKNQVAKPTKPSFLVTMYECSVNYFKKTDIDTTKIDFGTALRLGFAKESYKELSKTALDINTYVPLLKHFPLLNIGRQKKIVSNPLSVGIVSVSAPLLIMPYPYIEKTIKPENGAYASNNLYNQAFEALGKTYGAYAFKQILAFLRNEHKTFYFPSNFLCNFASNFIGKGVVEFIFAPQNEEYLPEFVTNHREVTSNVIKRGLKMTCLYFVGSLDGGIVNIASTLAIDAIIGNAVEEAEGS